MESALAMILTNVVIQRLCAIRVILPTFDALPHLATHIPYISYIRLHVTHVFWGWSPG